MKKTLLFLISVLCTTAILFGQTTMKTKAPGTTPNLKIVGEVAPAPVPAPAPAPVYKTTAPVTGTAPAASVYTMTSARVSIKTGTDNKEFPSQINLVLRDRNNAGLMWQPGANMRNELKSNSTTEIGLDIWKQVKPEQLILDNIMKSGLAFQILYLPNLYTDAWKIEGVSIVLGFKDQYGAELYKTINFNNASGFLNTWETQMVCYTDSQLIPTTSSIISK